MGTKMAPSYTNLVIAIFDILYVYAYYLQPLFWGRFNDDVFGIRTHDITKFNQFVKHLNRKSSKIKFTVNFSYEKN